MRFISMIIVMLVIVCAITLSNGEAKSEQCLSYIMKAPSNLHSIADFLDKKIEESEIIKIK